MGGRSGIGPITQFDTTDHPVTIAGEVRDFDPMTWISRKEAKKMDRFIHFAVGASMMALEDAGLPVPVPSPERTAVLIGVGLGGLRTIEDANELLRTRGPRRLSPFMLPRLISNLAPGQVSIMTGARGPNWSPVSACATGAHAIGEAVNMIREAAPMWSFRAEPRPPLPRLASLALLLCEPSRPGMTIQPGLPGRLTPTEMAS